MTRSSPFVTSRDRDAYASIRGFVYQIDLTILRWLDIDPLQHLELECGEDIDIVARACLEGSSEERYRTLQQVKFRSSSITLRTPSAVESLVNAVEHFASNPELRLSVCFISNAKSSRERPCPLPSGMSGIQVWESIRRDALANSDTALRLQQLRQILRSVSKPIDLSDERWQAFVQFVSTSSDESLLELVRHFEWNLNSPSAEALTEQVLAAIAARQSSPASTQDLYERLFLSVAKLLCLPGIKRLTKEKLELELTAPRLSTDDLRHLSHVREALSALSSRVEDLEALITDIGRRVVSLSEQQGLSNLAPAAYDFQTLTIQPLVQCGSFRADTVASLIAALDDCTWLHIFGTADTGKSQLAALLANHATRCPAWIRLHYDMPPLQVQDVVRDALQRASGILQPMDLPIWLQAVCARFGPGSLVVLDDLPLLSSDASELDTLQFLATACRLGIVKLASTSRYQLPNRLLDISGSSIRELPVPMFVPAEIEEVLTARGAPASCSEQRMHEKLMIVTRGHPLLVSLAIKYLSGHGWNADGDWFEALQRGDHDASALDDVLRRIASSLTSAQSALLARLSLAVTPVSDSVAKHLADVSPRIGSARDSIALLIGDWIQRDADGQIVVSPLAAKACAATLEADIAHLCHSVLAESILSQTMTVWDAQIAIAHLVNAAQYNKAGVITLIAHQRARKGRRIEVHVVCALWLTTRLPEAMSLHLRLMIRAMQLWTVSEDTRPSAFLLDDIDALLMKASAGDAHAAFTVAQIAALFLTRHTCVRALSYISRALELTRSTTATGLELPGLGDRSPPELLWTVIVHVNDMPSLRAWLTAVEKLPPEEQAVVHRSIDAKLGGIVLADRLLIVEADKPSELRDWQTILAQIDWLLVEAIKQEWVWLAACAWKAKIDIHGHWLRDADTIVQSAESFLATYGQDEQVAALVAGMLGRVLTVAQNYGAAIPWLERALTVRLARLDWDQTLVFLAAAQAFGVFDRQRAVELTNAAVKIATTSSDIPDFETAKTLAEAAIAQYQCYQGPEGARHAFINWSAAAERLFRISNRHEEWKEAFVLFAHVTSFLTSIAVTGVPPSETTDGGPFAEPFQSMFFTTKRERLEWFRENSVAPVLWMLSQYAWAVGDNKAYGEWLDRAILELAGRPLTGFDGLVLREQIASLLLQDRFDEAINAGMRTGQAMAISRSEIAQQSERKEILGNPIDEVFPQLTAEERQNAARLAITCALLPCFYRLATECIADEELGREHARQVSELCSSIASEPNADDRWSIAASLFNYLAESIAEPKFVLDQVNALEEGRYAELKILGYLIAAQLGNADVALHAQLAVLPLAVQWSPPEDRQYELVFMPYIQAFWEHRFSTMRFAFRAPQVVETSLRDAIASPVVGKLRRILRAVHEGLPIRGLTESIAWLMRED